MGLQQVYNNVVKPNGDLTVFGQLVVYLVPGIVYCAITVYVVV